MADFTPSEKVTQRLLKCIKMVMATNPEYSTQKDIIEVIRTSNAQVGRWRNGNGNCTLDNAVLACEHFGISYSYLFGGIGEMYGNADLTLRVDKLEKRVKAMELVIPTLKK